MKEHLDFNRGAKAGACSGLVLWFCYFIFSISTTSTYYSYMLPQLIIYGFFGFIILGAIYGVLFVKIYDKIPGEGSNVKGTVLSIIFWLALSILIPSIFNPRSAFDTSSVIILLLYVIFGFSTGMIYDKIKPTFRYNYNQNVRRCTNCGRIIPQDAKICPYCAKHLKPDENFIPKEETPINF